jgi:FeS assembly SUF system regulator
MIRMSKLTDYAIVLLSQLARSPDQSLHSARDLSAAAHIPVPTVNKLLRKLSRAGLLVSHRGANGGYSLARKASEISVGQVLLAMEGPVALTECGIEATGVCMLESSCPVRSSWQNINRAIRGALEGLSLSDMIHPPPPVGALSPVPTFSLLPSLSLAGGAR